MSFSLARSHVPSRDRDRSVVHFPNEEHNQVPPGFGSPESRVNIFALTISALNESELRVASKKFLDFVRFDTMLSTQLLDDLVEPDEAFDLQRKLFCRMFTFSSRRPAAATRLTHALVRRTSLNRHPVSLSNPSSG